MKHPIYKVEYKYNQLHIVRSSRMQIRPWLKETRWINDMKEDTKYIIINQHNHKDLETNGVMRPTAAEEHPQGRLLGEPKATKALLQFLASTNVALPRTRLQRRVERAQRDDEWGLKTLEEAIRTGEG